jgi:hypothetical protein
VADTVVMISERIMTFDWTTVGETSSPQTVTISNESGSTFTVSALTVGGTDASSFAVQNDTVTGSPIADADSATFDITFTPQSAGKETGTVTIESADISGSPYVIAVEGLSTDQANTPPEKPVLIYPANGATGVPADTTFIWEDVSDADGDDITYWLYVDVDQTFADTTPVEVAVGKPTALMAGIGSILGLAFFGMFIPKRRRSLTGIVTLVVLVVVVAMACGELPGTTPQPGEGESGSTAPNLEGGTTYYWKIVADDGNGGLTSSDVWSFSTE